MRLSGLFETQARIVLDQPVFLNAVCRLASSWEPERILGRLLEIELELGRDRVASVEKGPRIIDLDLLMVGQLTVDSLSLVLPHPEMTSRRFVLAPLAELAGDLLVPPGGQSVRALLACCADDGWVERLNETSSMNGLK